MECRPCQCPSKLLHLQWDLPSGVEGPERTLEMSGKYAEAIKDIAKARGLPALDLWSELQAIKDWQSLLSDGLHFAPSGSQAVFNLLKQLIDNSLPQFRSHFETYGWQTLPYKWYRLQASSMIYTVIICHHCPKITKRSMTFNFMSLEAILTFAVPASQAFILFKLFIHVLSMVCFSPFCMMAVTHVKMASPQKVALSGLQISME